MTTSNFSIRKGSIIIYRVFDIAEEVDLAEIERQALGKMVGQRLKLDRRIRSELVIKNAPVSFVMGESQFVLGPKVLKAALHGKFWDYGVLSLAFHIPLDPGMGWQDLLQLSQDLDNLTGIDGEAQRRAAEVCDLFRPALKDPHDWSVFEDYVIYFLEEATGVQEAYEIVEKFNVESLILAEPVIDVSKDSRTSILEYTYQYSKRDLALIDWNSALIVEPSGSKDIPDVIEFALTHLMEMRFYDDLLDRRLGYLYDQIELTRGTFMKDKFAKIYFETSALYIEFSEFIERVDNSLKAVGDFYLARIFRAAARRFRIPDWQESITRKLNIVAQVSNLIQAEINMKRSHWLELIVVFLITFEIAMVLLNRH